MYELMKPMPAFVKCKLFFYVGFKNIHITYKLDENIYILYCYAFIISSNYAHNWTKGLQPKHRVAVLFSLFSSENINRKKLQEKTQSKTPQFVSLSIKDTRKRQQQPIQQQQQQQ